MTPPSWPPTLTRSCADPNSRTPSATQTDALCPRYTKGVETGWRSFSLSCRTTTRTSRLPVALHDDDHERDYVVGLDYPCRELGEDATRRGARRRWARAGMSPSLSSAQGASGRGRQTLHALSPPCLATNAAQRYGHAYAYPSPAQTPPRACTNDGQFCPGRRCPRLPSTLPSCERPEYYTMTHIRVARSQRTSQQRRLSIEQQLPWRKNPLIAIRRTAKSSQAQAAYPARTRRRRAFYSTRDCFGQRESRTGGGRGELERDLESGKRGDLEGDDGERYASSTGTKARTGTLGTIGARRCRCPFGRSPLEGCTTTPCSSIPHPRGVHHPSGLRRAGRDSELVKLKIALFVVGPSRHACPLGLTPRRRSSGWTIRAALDPQPGLLSRLDTGLRATGLLLESFVHRLIAYLGRSSSPCTLLRPSQKRAANVVLGAVYTDVAVG
uniref:Uncharacterized protein n=1 Tax=Mycena chlorophos TaxID=658473 RepID=A0ABQ0LDL9_MYCCL|nr:predicted protein [Mycena chlorophos]